MAELWHITLVTHNSRYSDRMRKFHVRTGPAFWMEPEDEVRLCAIIEKIVEKYTMIIHRLNICGDHAHFLMEVADGKLEDTIKTLKSVSALEYKKILGIPSGTKFHLWAQKFNKRLVGTPEYLKTVIKYFSGNRIKHKLPENRELQKVINRIVKSDPC